MDDQHDQKIFRKQVYKSSKRSRPKFDNLLTFRKILEDVNVTDYAKSAKDRSRWEEHK